MRRTILAVALALWAGATAGAIKYKCDGEWVDYWPCDNKPAEGVAASNDSNLSDEAATNDSKLPEEAVPVVFNGTKRLAQAAAELEDTLTIARACHWEQQKNGRNGQSCSNLLAKSQKSQAGEELVRLAKDTAFLKINRNEFDRLEGIQREIIEVMGMSAYMSSVRSAEIEEEKKEFLSKFSK